MKRGENEVLRVEYEPKPPVPPDATKSINPQPPYYRRSFLSELRPYSIINVWGDAFRSDGRISGNVPIKVRGKESPHGIFTHPLSGPPSEVGYDINGRWDFFRGAVAINPNPAGYAYPGAPLTFEVIGDGRALWKSDPVTKSDEPQLFDISVKAIKRIRLRVHSSGSINTAWAVWVEPILIRGESSAGGAGGSPTIAGESPNPGAEKVAGTVPGVSGMGGLTTGRMGEVSPGHQAPKTITNSIGMTLKPDSGRRILHGLARRRHRG